MWGIHAGKHGEADGYFLSKNVVGLGWAELKDLSLLDASRESFKLAVTKGFPQAKPNAVPIYAGQLYRFAHEVQAGDIVVYPSKMDRQIHIGRVRGAYKYDPKANARCPHVRAVTWLRQEPRTRFSLGALHEVGSAMSFFQIRNYADEFRAAISGNFEELPVSQDESVAAVAEDIEETTRDFVLKQLGQELKGLPLEDFIRHLLECMGYQARLARRNEPSVDIIAHKDLLGVEPPIIKVQVKSGDGTVKDRDVSALVGKLSQTEYGLFITLGTFSPSCRNTEQSRSNLRLIDGQELVDLIFQHYERFDSRYKGLLPLRQVYVPQAMPVS